MPANAKVDFQKIKMKDKYRELRTAIAAVRKVNRQLLAILPQWPEAVEWVVPRTVMTQLVIANEGLRCIWTKGMSDR